jgi:predicted dehydrogenase
MPSSVEQTAAFAGVWPMPSPGGELLRVGIIGLGYWGPNLLRVLADDVDVEIAWICDRDPQRLARYHRRHPNAQATERAELIFEDRAVDAVVIATPVASHFTLAAASLAAGKHTFIEKPLAPSVQLAEALVTLARRAGRLLMCGHTFLYSPAVRAVKRMLDDRVLGDVYFASSSRVNLGPYRNDVSVIWDLGPHDFSILHYWFGEVPVTIRATGRDALTSGIADVAFVAMTFASGLVANVELSWLAPSKLRRTVVVGSEKMIVYDDGAPQPVRLFDHGIVLGEQHLGEYELSYRTGEVISPRLETGEPLAAELLEFTAAARRRDPLEWQAALACDVVRMLEATAESLDSGGATVALSGAGDAAARPPTPLRPRPVTAVVGDPVAAVATEPAA